jgi:nucleoside-diphosphate-sugar epimerase
MMSGMPAVPKLGFSFVDVRDVARLQLLAMRAPEAGGERFIAVSRFLWMSEVGEVLRDHFGARVKVTTRTAPNLLIRAMALVDRSLGSIVGDLGVRVEYSNERARTRLGWQPRPVETSIVETAESLIREGIVEAA